MFFFLTVNQAGPDSVDRSQLQAVSEVKANICQMRNRKKQNETKKPSPKPKQKQTKRESGN